MSAAPTAEQLLAEAQRAVGGLRTYANCMPYGRYDEIADLIEQIASALTEAQERERELLALVDERANGSTNAGLMPIRLVREVFKP